MDEAKEFHRKRRGRNQGMDRQDMMAATMEEREEETETERSGHGQIVDDRENGVDFLHEEFDVDEIGCTGSGKMIPLDLCPIHPLLSDCRSEKAVRNAEGVERSEK